jgi:hypothetical protein
LIRPVSHPATGLRFDLAEEQPASVIDFLAGQRDNLPHHEHGLICETAGGDQRVYVVRRPGGGYSVRHYPGCGHHGGHDVIPESDEHKRGKDYASGELDRFGLSAGQEVRTDNRTRHDVATLDARRIIAVEFQAYNDIEDREYKARTTRAMHATAFTGKHARPLPDGGVLPVWLHGFGMPAGWKYPVPSIAAQDTRWDVMPKPGSVTAIGPRAIEAEPCRPGSRWPACPRTGRGWCGDWHPFAALRAGLRIGEVAAMTASTELMPIRYHTAAVYLVSPADAARYAELGGDGTWSAGTAGERPPSRLLGPCRSPQHAVPPEEVPQRARSWQPRQCRGCGAPVRTSQDHCDSCLGKLAELTEREHLYLAMLASAREERERRARPASRPVRVARFATVPFWCETCGRTHPLAEHRECRNSKPND